MAGTILVIVGITGDLSKRKLLPSVHHLLKNRKISEEISIIGIGRKRTSPKELAISTAPFIRKPEQDILQRIEKSIIYIRGDLGDQATYKGLRKEISELQDSRGFQNVLYYLATLPEHFEAITTNLSHYGLAQNTRGWTRVVFEKPFGNGLEHARKLNAAIKKVFREDQIYRIDHYLGKELVQNIAVLRFSNTVLEPLWNKNHIDHVQIIMNENVGVGTRGEFYDRYGALKDVIQNHMLQLLALTAMEAPSKFNAMQIRNEKFKVLQSTRIVSPSDVVLGQYAGYQKEPGVMKNSKTETFSAMKAYVDNLRWQHVPFYLKTGKFLQNHVALIYIQFEEAPGVIFEQKTALRPNHLVISIQPDEGFYLKLNAKVPGGMDITQVKMDFCHSCVFGANTPEAYETLLHNVFLGDQSVFVRSDEVEESWRIIGQIIDSKIKVYPYTKNSQPKEADDFLQKENRRWFT